MRGLLVAFLLIVAGCDSDSLDAPPATFPDFKWSEPVDIRLAETIGFYDLHDLSVDASGSLDLLVAEIDDWRTVAPGRLLHLERSAEGMWSAPVELAQSSTLGPATMGTTSTGELHVAWWENKQPEVSDDLSHLVTRSSDGQTWGEPEVLLVESTQRRDKANGNDMVRSPSGALHLVARRGDRTLVHFATDQGQMRKLATMPSGLYPEFATGFAPRLQLAYTATRVSQAGEQAKSNVYFGDVDESGGLSRETLAYEQNTSSSHRPVAAVDATGRRHLVWYQNVRGQPRQLYHSHGSNGWYWSTPESIAVTEGTVWDISTAADGGGRLHVVVNTSNPSLNVYLRREADGTWSRPQKLFPSMGAFGARPQLAYDTQRGILHLIIDSGSRRIYHTTMTRLNE
ncbi:MAG: hypothetical protein AAF752_00805 [Bacteroidota bacterium]